MAPAEGSDPGRRRMWRRVRTSVTLLILVGVVVGAAWYSWRNVLDLERTTADPGPEPCAPGIPTAPPKPANIQLNVYNATDRDGLASEVARQLQQRGFVVIDIANDPLDKTINGPAEVRSNLKQQSAAALVASLVPGAAYVRDERADPVVDLVLGEAFEALAKPKAPPSTSNPSLPPCEPVGG